MRLKPLLPSLREKKRYLAYQVCSKETVEKVEAEKAIETELKQLIGTLGTANASLLFLRDWDQNKGILKVQPKYVDYVKASLALITNVNGKQTTIKSVAVSGMVGKLRRQVYN
jgi:ribonuclease P/MRP protein subunit POP5